MSETDGHGDLGKRSVGELVSQLSEQVSQLVRDEPAPARAELEQKGTRHAARAGGGDRQH